ncbi:VCBS repeat-containing protein [Aureibaculum conchae]|uniref:VCBS repeat-containing protein n=1 Tax=Aureibaculum sp. 2308TA14-22 TaxID=3108392 RepID=UPI003396B1EA
MSKLFSFFILKSISLCSVFIFFSCSEIQTYKEEKDDELFSALTIDDTGLIFKNNLKESTTMNWLYYEYFYNGAGVVVADFNNDGLQDIYFTSNLSTNKLFLNKGGLKFKNVSVTAKAQGDGGFCTGVTVVDINNDGLKDIYLLKSGRFKSDDPLRNELLINIGVDDNNIPLFENKAKEYGLDLPHNSTQASFFDYDKDGDLDMFLINHNIDVYNTDNISEVMRKTSNKIGEKLYRNDNGKYIDVTKEAGIISNNIGFGLGIAIGDVNNDGWPDVYTSNDYYEKDHLYLNNQDGSFKETSLKSFGHVPTFSMGNDIADINNDGYLDIVSLDMMAEDNYSQKASMSAMNPEQFHTIEDLGLHSQYMYNALQINNGLEPNTNVPLFSDIAQLANVAATDWSWAPLLLDMDNDGFRDLFISNGIKRDIRNNDFLIYMRKKEKEAIKKGGVNQEEYMKDLLSKMPTRKKKNYFYLNSKNLVFEKLNLTQPATFSNGAAYADFDNDGDLDIIVNNVDDFPILYRNNQESNSFLSIKLQGTSNNKDALGTRVIVTANKETFIAENYYTRGYQSAMAIPLHFGLGDSKKVDSINIVWPDGKSQTLFDIEVNKEMTITYNPNENNKYYYDSPKNVLFQDITESIELRYKQEENDYNDFIKESLLPHKMSQEGPAMSVGDINNDGLDDIFIGGAKGYSAALYIQNRGGQFKNSNESLFIKEKQYEDVGASFFDADNDGDLDLYVVSGSNEYGVESKYYQDRLYTNNNGIYKKAENPFENVPAVSGSIVKPYDFDNDGDQDLFVGGRQSPEKYPLSGTSLLLRNDSENGNIKFTNINAKVLDEIGMVTDAEWTDIDGDNVKELVLVGEWMPVSVLKNNKGIFTNITTELGLEKATGWWFSLNVADYDNDGDIDIIAGNLGLNSKYQSTPDEPFEVYAKDFDNTGTLDIVLGYHQEGKLFPLRGRSCSSQQMPFIKKKFKSYHEFASAELIDVYGKENIDAALKYEANTFATSYFENDGKGNFTIKQLPMQAQTTAITSIISEDVNQDGNLDLLLFGNIYGFEVETPRQDAGYGFYLEGDGKGNFKPLMPYKSGLYVKGDVANAQLINLSDNLKVIGVAKNDDYFQLIKMN